MESARAFPPVAISPDMMGVIAGYHSGLEGRIYAIVNAALSCTG